MSSVEAKLFFFQILQGISNTLKESKSNLEAKLFPERQEKPKPEPEIRIWFPINLEELEQPEEEEEVLTNCETDETEVNDDRFIDPKHFAEWEASGIDPDIIRLNLQSLSGDAAYSFLLYSEHLDRTNTGRLQARPLKRYEHLKYGGWWCNGIDPVTGKSMDWGCLKPNSPCRMPDGKLIKYEHPPKEATRAFFLQVPFEIWQKIAFRYGVAMPSAVEDISFWEWVLSHPELPIVLTEGVKKAAAFLSIGVTAVAIPGIFSGYRRHKNEAGQPIGDPFLIPDLAILYPKNSEVKRPIIFAFDQDEKRSTRENVGKAIATTGKLFTKKNCVVFVAEWEAKLGKGIDDVLVRADDEMEGETVYQILKKADSFDIWKAKQYAKLSYQPDVRVSEQFLTIKDRENFHIPTELLPPKNCQLLLMRSYKGSGKTEYLRALAAPYLSAGRKVLLISHRVQLGQNLCDRIGIPYVIELSLSEEGRLLGFGLCHHSMHSKSSAKFDPHEFEGAVIIIDEIVQVLWDVLSSPLIEKNQIEILTNLKECIRHALSTGGMLVGCDADLNDWAINYIRKLIGFNVRQHLIVNDWKPAIDGCWQVFNYDGRKPTGLIRDLIEHIKNGEKTFVLCSSQEEKSMWSTQNLENYLKTQFPELQILRIDSESIADPSHPAYGCTSKLNELLLKYQVVLASPTLETGVDIKIKGHFDSVWGMFWGVQTADGVRQFLARLRDNVPRHIWVNKIGLTRVGRGGITHQSLWKNTDTVFRGTVNRLMSAGFDSEFDDNFQSESLNAYCQRGALINLQRKAYRETILNGIESEGHTLINASEVYQFDADELKALEAELEAFKDGFYLKHREKVAAKNNPDDARFEALKKQKVRTKEELRELEHGTLARRYQVPVTPDLVQKDDDGWLPQIKLHYHLTMGRKFVETKDKNAATTHLKNGDGKVWKPTFNKRQIGLKVEFIEKSGLMKLFELKEIRVKDVQPIIEFGKQYSNDLKAVGISANWEDKPISVTKNLLNNLLGLKITRIRREGSKGSQQWVYSGIAADFQRDDEGQLLLDESGLPIAISDGREEVFQQWLISDTAKAETLEKTEVTALTPVPAPIVEEVKPETKLICINGSLEEIPVTPVTPVTSVASVAKVALAVPVTPVTPVTSVTPVTPVAPVEEAIAAIKPESLIGRGVKWFCDYANKELDLGKIQAIDSMADGKVVYETSEGWYPSLDDLLNNSLYHVA